MLTFLSQTTVTEKLSMRTPGNSVMPIIPTIRIMIQVTAFLIAIPHQTPDDHRRE